MTSFFNYMNENIRSDEYKHLPSKSFKAVRLGAYSTIPAVRVILHLKC